MRGGRQEGHVTRLPMRDDDPMMLFEATSVSECRMANMGKMCRRMGKSHAQPWRNATGASQSPRGFPTDRDGGPLFERRISELCFFASSPWLSTLAMFPLRSREAGVDDEAAAATRRTGRPVSQRGGGSGSGSGLAPDASASANANKKRRTVRYSLGICFPWPLRGN